MILLFHSMNCCLYSNPPLLPPLRQVALLLAHTIPRTIVNAIELDGLNVAVENVDCVESVAVPLLQPVLDLLSVVLEEGGVLKDVGEREAAIGMLGVAVEVPVVDIVLAVLALRRLLTPPLRIRRPLSQYHSYPGG